MNRKILVILAFLFVFAGCSQVPGDLNGLNIEGISQLDQHCTDVYTQQVDTWAARDPELLKDIYTDDIVHYDGYPAYTGIDSVAEMAKGMFRYFGNWEMAAGEVYISADKCVGTWLNWEIFGLKEDNPGREFDLIEIQDDKIFFWRLFYDENFGMSYVDTPYLTNYAETWSQENSAEIIGLYAEDAVYEDSLFGIQAQGLEQIEKQIDEFLARGTHQWTISIPYAENKAEWPYKEEIPFPSKGGVFNISVQGRMGKSCNVVAFLILTPDADGLIVKQEIFYLADSLIDCGWVK